jgi:hypothetical protein
MTPDRELLVGLLKSAPQVRNEMWRLDPALGTKAAADSSEALERFGTRDAGVRLYELANLWLIIAAEHIHGVGVLIEDQRSWTAMFPLIRSSMELCGGILWLVNEALFEDRAARAAVAILDGAERRLENEAYVGRGSSAYLAAKTERDELVALFRTEFGNASLSPASVRGILMPAPTAFLTDLASRRNDFSKWKGLYGHLCGMGCHPSTGLGSLMRQLDPTKAQLSISDDQLESYMNACLHPFLLALGAVGGAMGWDRTLFDAFHQHTLEVLS